MIDSTVGVGSHSPLQSVPSTDGPAPAMTNRLLARISSVGEYYIIQCPFCLGFRAWRPYGTQGDRLRILCPAPCGRWYQSVATRKKYGARRANTRRTPLFLAPLSLKVPWAMAIMLARRMGSWNSMRTKRMSTGGQLHEGPMPLLRDTDTGRWHPATLPAEGYSMHLLSTYPISLGEDEDLWLIQDDG